ncbi:TPA: hypothetical protein NHT77_000806 [Raoultella ornithinolytica]|nr:hypothetical protein [Raoultella ornithinolytica]
MSEERRKLIKNALFALIPAGIFSMTKARAAIDIPKNSPKNDSDTMPYQGLVKKKELTNGEGGRLITLANELSPETIRSLKCKASDYLTVKDFGAIGDGSNLDSDNINRAFKRGVGKLYIPHGRYLLNKTISIRSHAHIVMDSASVFLPGNVPITLIEGFGKAPEHWENLTSDALSGSSVIFIRSDLFNVGDWVELNSDELIKENVQGKRGCLRRIISKDGTGPYSYQLDTPLYESYNSKYNARVGVATVIEDVILDGINCNQQKFKNLIKFGINLRYAVNVKIISPKIYGSKVKNSADIKSFSGLKLYNCRNVQVISPYFESLGWYGVEILGFSQDVTIIGGAARDVRHSVCINESAPYGEPTNVEIKGFNSFNTTLSGFDTHRVGKNILFENCKSESANDCGFQIRTDKVKVINCSAYNSRFDGLIVRGDNPQGPIIEKGDYSNNNRSGINFFNCVGSILNSHISCNKVSGIVILGGRISGAEIYNNGVAIDCGGSNYKKRQSDTLVENINAPASEIQKHFLLLRNEEGRSSSYVTLLNSEIPGYGRDVFIFSRKSGIKALPNTSGNTLASSLSGTIGRVYLENGFAKVNNTDVRLLNLDDKTDVTANLSSLFISKIEVQRLLLHGTPGVLSISHIVDGESFTIISSDKKDCSLIEWKVTF